MLFFHVKLPAVELHACVNWHNLSLAKNQITGVPTRVTPQAEREPKQFGICSLSSLQ